MQYLALWSSCLMPIIPVYNSKSAWQRSREDLVRPEALGACKVKKQSHPRLAVGPAGCVRLHPPWGGQGLRLGKLHGP
ncbi:unnamed protein product [Lampetra planeri]